MVGILKRQIGRIDRLQLKPGSTYTLAQHHTVREIPEIVTSLYGVNESRAQHSIPP